MSDTNFKTMRDELLSKSYSFHLPNLVFWKGILLLLLGVLIISCSPAPTSSDETSPELASSVEVNELPDLSGIWQALNTAHWDVEGHTARGMPVTNILGAYGVMQAGTSVVVGDVIPYLPETRAQQKSNQTDWANLDPAAKCYIPGIPRQTYMPAPFQILQTDSEIFIAFGVDEF